MNAIRRSSGQSSSEPRAWRVAATEKAMQRVLVQVLFNAGVFLTRLDGTVIAELPVRGRVGFNDMDSDDIAAVVRQGKATVGRPFSGKKVLAPSFATTLPMPAALASSSF